VFNIGRNLISNQPILANVSGSAFDLADDVSISNQWLGSKLIHSQVGKYHEKNFQRFAQPP
jgi:hypothetical protein